MSDLKTFLNNGNKINEVIITLNSKESSDIIEIISNLRNLDVCIKIVPGMYDLLTGYAQMHSVTGMPLIDINPNILTELQVILKRILDLIVSFGFDYNDAYINTVAILIKLTSKGSIIFKQERIGLNGKHFIWYINLERCIQIQKKIQVHYGQKKMIQVLLLEYLKKN